MIIHSYLIVIPLILLVTRTNFKDVTSVDAVNTRQKILNQNSIPHNVLGRKSHQVVTLVNTTGEKIFDGTVNLHSTFQVNIINYKITSNNTLPSNYCNIRESYYKADKLLSCSHQAEVEFTGSGLVVHLPSHDGFQMNFTINSLQTE